MRQKFLGDYVKDDVVGKLFDFSMYRPDRLYSPLTPHGIHFYKNNCFITAPLFIKDANLDIYTLSKAIFLLYEQYPFLNADQIFNEKEQWEFYRSIKYEFVELTSVKTLKSLDEISEVQNVSYIDNSSQSNFSLYQLKIDGFNYPYMLLLQVCHAIVDGSSVLTLITRLNEIYKNVKRNPEYKIDKTKIQNAPFCVMACLNNNDHLQFKNTNVLMGGSAIIPKIQSPLISEGERSINWELMFFDAKIHKLHKYNGNTLTLSLSFYQLALQIAYGYQTGQYVDTDKQNILIGNFSHRVYDELKPYDFSYIIGNSVFNSIFRVKITKDMTFRDLIQQLEDHENSIKKLSKEEKMAQMLTFELMKCPTKVHNYPMSVYSVTMGKYVPQEDDIVQAYAMAPVQITTDYDTHFFNFTVVGLEGSYAFEWDNFVLTKHQRAKIVAMFWALNEKQPDPSSKICDYITFDQELLLRI